MKYNFLSRENDTVFFIGDTMEIYIPKNFFDLKMATFQGNMIQTLGLFQFIVYPDDNRKSESGESHYLTLPMNIKFQFENFFNTKKDNMDFKVFILKKGNIFTEHENLEKSAENTKNFIFKINSGKIPNDIPYDEIMKIYLESLTLNGVNLGNPACLYEVKLAELYRDPKDETIPFRKTINKTNGKIGMTNYQTINITELPNIKGTFQAIMFENIRQSIQYSILRAKNGDPGVESPLEEVMKY